MKYHTRFAPSPTGFVHLGNFRTAYFNWLAARASGGTFMLRIDDTDLNRSNPEFTQVIFDTMKWLDLGFDRRAYQSQRFDIYRHQANDLVQKGHAKVVDNATILFPSDFHDQWKDQIAGQIQITDDDKDIMRKGIVLIKSDGSPTYHFASVVDDINFGINCVIRGVDHITNTSRQATIYKAFGVDLPMYYHIGLIHMGGKKLSKRDGAASMLWYRDQGYDPDAMLNFMARMGWGPTVDDKTASFLPRNRMLDLFLTGGKMRSASSNIDMAKLAWYDKKYKAMNRV